LIVAYGISARCIQKQCIEFVINAKPACRYAPKNKNSIKYRIWRVVVSTTFEYLIMVLIAFNTLLLMMKVSVLLASDLTI